MALGPVGRRIESELRKAFAPASLEVIDESYRHEGHAGARPEGETHFRVKIKSERLRGAARAAQHRMVNEALKDLLGNPVHALAIEASAP